MTRKGVVYFQVQVCRNTMVFIVFGSFLNNSKYFTLDRNFCWKTSFDSTSKENRILEVKEALNVYSGFSTKAKLLVKNIRRSIYNGKNLS